MSGLVGYLAADSGSKKFDMVDGGEYNGDKACKFFFVTIVLFSLFFAG